nr:hypothetical protein [Tanacetum cinerariifolium]
MKYKENDNQMRTNPLPRLREVPYDLPAVSTHVDIEVHAEESTPDDNPTTSEQVSAEHSVVVSTPSSSHKRRKQIAKKWVTPIVDITDDALIMFDSTSNSDDDPLPYVPYAGWEMVPSPLGSIHAIMIWRGTPNTSLLFVNFYTWWRRMIFSDCWSLDDDDARDFWRNQDGWRIRSWRLYPRAQVYVLETVDGQVIYMFVDVSYPLSAATLQRMLKHGLEVPKFLVGGDLTMAEQLVTQNWMVFTFHVPFWNEKWLVQWGTALGKDFLKPVDG